MAFVKKEEATRSRSIIMDGDLDAAITSHTLTRKTPSGWSPRYKLYVIHLVKKRYPRYTESSYVLHGGIYIASNVAHSTT